MNTSQSTIWLVPYGDKKVLNLLPQIFIQYLFSAVHRRTSVTCPIVQHYLPQRSPGLVQVHKAYVEWMSKVSESLQATFNEAAPPKPSRSVVGHRVLCSGHAQAFLITLSSVAPLLAPLDATTCHSIWRWHHGCLEVMPRFAPAIWWSCGNSGRTYNVAGLCTLVMYDWAQN